jgi:CRISPR-associated protein Cas1
MQDLHELPKLSDSLSYLYVEHAIIEQQARAVEVIDKSGRTMIPAAALTVLLLGPGTSITHAAIKSLADNGCGILWVGEDATRFYASGTGETRRAYHLLHQARLASDPGLRLEVCKRMYRRRFDEELGPDLTIEQLRGMEGARVRTAYAQASLRYGVEWHGRRYKRNSWNSTDSINRALSAANALLNGLCHAAIVSGGYSPALGFIHTGKQRSFVYDIADLYKVEVTIPVAFQITGRSTQRLGPRVREACRDAFKEQRLLQRILPDIHALLDVSDDTLEAGSAADGDPARPEPLWTPSAEGSGPSASPATGEEALDLWRQQVEAQTEPASSESREALSEETLSEEALRTLPHEGPDEKALRLRRERAEAGLEKGWKLRQTAPDTWHVVTRPESAGYTIRRVEGELTCDCPDFVKRELGACKHTLAVKIARAREALSTDG